MPRDIRQVVADIDALAPADPDALDLDRLQALMGEYFSLAEAPSHLGVWFRLYERYPEFDGYGVFWTILHGVEAQPGYQPLVIESLRRHASRFPVLLAGRLLNGGVGEVGGASLVGLLRQVAASVVAPESVRADAADWVQRHAEPGAAADPGRM